MRVFIGIKLSDDVHEKIGKFLKPFKRIASPIRWVEPACVHVTLKFIGEMSPGLYDRMSERLNAIPYPMGTFDLSLSGCGKFGRGQSLSIFWIGISHNEKLTELFHLIEETIAPLNIKKESRDFTPHITVARNKRDFNFKSLYRLMEENKDQLIASFPVTAFQVFKSDLNPEGPVYTILKEIPLVTA